MSNEFKPTYLEALSMTCGYPVFTTNPFSGEFKPMKSILKRYNFKIMNEYEITPPIMDEFDKTLKLLHESTHDDKVREAILIVQEFKTKLLD